MKQLLFLIVYAFYCTLGHQIVFNDNDQYLNPLLPTFVFSDPHGDLHRFLENLRIVSLVTVQNYSRTDETSDMEKISFDSVTWTGGASNLIITGDVMDKGPFDMEIWQVIMDIRKQAKRVGGQVEALMGNHEYLNLRGDFSSTHPSQRDKLSARWSMLQPGTDLGFYLRRLKAAVRVGDDIFGHAGIMSKFAPMGIDRINQAVTDAIVDRRYDDAILGEDGPLFTRRFSGEHYDETEVCPELMASLEILHAQRMIVGHSKQPNGFIGSYCGGRLLMIDLGVSRWNNLPTDKEKSRMGGVKIERGDATAFYQNALPLDP